MTVEQLVSSVATVGFPAAVAVVLLRWMLTKLATTLESMNGKMDRLTDAVTENTAATRELVECQGKP